MQPFESIISQVIPLDINNVDTDMIIPAQYLTKIDREGYAEHLFQRLREQDPKFIFNDPKFNSAQILVTKANFGCGSSREHAVWALMQAGIKVIIAQSYSDIFDSNAAKNGLLAICLDSKDISYLIKKALNEGMIINVNLPQQTITTSSKDVFSFVYDPFRKECLLKGQDDLDYLLQATFKDE